MNAKKGIVTPNNYAAFSDPYAGLATMILVQAESDRIALGEREQLRSSGVVVSREEITAFFRSKWAAMLAAGAGLESYTIEGFQC